MKEGWLYYIVIIGGMIAAGAAFLALLFFNAPYGRHIRQGWGPLIANKFGWIIMESPSALLFALYFFQGSTPKNLPIIILFSLWELHYIHRTFIYPLTIRDGYKKMPLAVVLMGFIFNLGNSYANGHYLFDRQVGYSMTWLRDPRFITGTILFLLGFILNRWADWNLRWLRKPGETCYRIPYGGLFKLISCPNYLGEIIEWFGWAVATWSLPGLVFAIWTFANLAPRARSHHVWYHANFSEYPAERKALIPWLW